MDKDILQNNLRLKYTKMAVNNFREAKVKDLDKKIIEELERIIPLVAKLEWGKDTETDDFSIEGKFIIKKGKKEEII